MTRTQAPFGRRELTVAARRELGAYVILTAPDPAGPRPQAGQFYMLAAATGWGGGADERPYLPRAFSVARADAEGLHFRLEGVGPGTDRLCALAPGDGLLVTGPLGLGFARSDDGRRPRPVGRTPGRRTACARARHPARPGRATAWPG